MHSLQRKFRCRRHRSYLKAKPQSATGYTFDGWTVNGKTSEEKNETLTLNITKNTTVSAAYTLNTVSYAVNYGVTSKNGTLTAKNGTKTFDSGAKQPAGSTIVFTAQPKDGYQVKGWYTAAEGGSAIPDTTSEQNSYTITNLTAEATVYAAFEPIPTYDITINDRSWSCHPQRSTARTQISRTAS